MSDLGLVGVQLGLAQVVKAARCLDRLSKKFMPDVELSFILIVSGILPYRSLAMLGSLSLLQLSKGQ